MIAGFLSCNPLGVVDHTVAPLRVELPAKVTGLINQSNQNAMIPNPSSGGPCCFATPSAALAARRNWKTADRDIVQWGAEFVFDFENKFPASWEFVPATMPITIRYGKELETTTTAGEDFTGGDAAAVRPPFPSKGIDPYARVIVGSCLQWPRFLAPDIPFDEQIVSRPVWLTGPLLVNWLGYRFWSIIAPGNELHYAVFALLWQPKLEADDNYIFMLTSQTPSAGVCPEFTTNWRVDEIAELNLWKPPIPPDTPGWSTVGGIEGVGGSGYNFWDVATVAPLSVSFADDAEGTSITVQGFFYPRPQGYEPEPRHKITLDLDSRFAFPRSYLPLAAL